MELDLMALVSNLGFPAIVTMYLLIRIEGKLENLSTSINSLSNNIYELNNKKWKNVPNKNSIGTFFI